MKANENRSLWIDVKMPYEPNRKLAYAYNRAMESAATEWVLLYDHDIYLSTNPWWYQMSLDAIKQLEGQKVGWITAKTNRIGNKSQLHNVVDDSDDLNQHIDIAADLYRTYGNTLSVARGSVSGFFILTNRTAWKAVGGFQDRGKGLSAVDVTYCKALRAKNFGIHVMEGLYFYHFYKKRKKELYAKF
ncbi:MAG: hypothetical protein B7C24_10155 [Bacteroidetes bacterium 4572_77]|nr:MAG: hypothetical protein B7C24_10155 [Bacteroidetes bacterium 4572_77]